MTALLRLPGLLALVAITAPPSVAAEPAATDDAALREVAPRYTEVWASVGIRYNHNYSINTDRIEQSSSTLQEVGLSVYDDRPVWSQRLRSSGTIDVSTDLDDHDRDFQILTASTGPVFQLSESWKLHTALGGWVSYFGYDFYSGLGAAYLTWEYADTLLRSVELHAGVEHFGDEFDGGDVPWVDVFTNFELVGLLREDDWMDGQLFFEHYHTDEPVFRYSQIAGTLAYSSGLWGPVEASISLTGWQRFYYGSEIDVGSDRRDTTITTELSLLHSGLFLEPLSVELRGLYERNWSNDDRQDYDGGSAMLLLHWRF